MSVYTHFFIFIAVVCACNLASAEKMMRPKLKDVKLWSDEKFLTHKMTFDQADPHLNFSLDLHQDANDVDLHLEARITNKADPFYGTTFNSTINLCRLVGFATKSPVGRFVHGFLREYGYIIDACPIVKGKYFLNKFWWPEDPTTAILPEVDFEINFAAYHLDASKKRTLVINDHITGEFVVQDVNNVKPGIFAMLPKGA